MQPSRQPALLAALSGLVGVLLLALTGCNTPAPTVSAPPADLFREIGYEDAVDQSASQNKPLFLFFDGNDTSDNIRLLSHTLGNPVITALLHEHTISLHIETDDLPDIAKKYRINTVPVLVLISPTGHELRRWRGSPKPERFATEIAALLVPTSAPLPPAPPSVKSAELAAQQQTPVEQIPEGQ